MSQDWVDDVFGETHDGITDLENMEKNFLALKSLFSGASEPTFTKVAGMPWYDTGQKILKIRNSVNTSWYGVMQGNESFKIWVYLNSLTGQEGWGLDGSSATDMVIGLKGSSRYTTGAVNAGSWTLPDTDNESAHTHPLNNHVHSLLGTIIQTDKYLTSPGEEVVYDEYTDDWYIDTGAYGAAGGMDISKLSGPDTGPNNSNSGAGSAHKHTHTDSGTWGIRAAVGVMAFPDINP